MLIPFFYAMYLNITLEVLKKILVTTTTIYLTLFLMYTFLITISVIVKHFLRNYKNYFLMNFKKYNIKIESFIKCLEKSIFNKENLMDEIKNSLKKILTIFTFVNKYNCINFFKKYKITFLLNFIIKIYNFILKNKNNLLIYNFFRPIIFTKNIFTKIIYFFKKLNTYLLYTFINVLYVNCLKYLLNTISSTIIFFNIILPKKIFLLKNKLKKLNYNEILSLLDEKFKIYFFKLHFNKLSFFKKSISKNFKKWKSFFFKKKIIHYSLFFFSIFIFIYKFNFNIGSFFFYKIFVILFIIYIYITFLHLSKYYVFNKYTSVIQRFWKRSFSVFWSLEITLFFIYIYLMIISPAEYNYQYLNQKEYQSNLIFISSSYYTYFYFFLLFLITLLKFSLFFVKKKHNINTLLLPLIIILFIYTYILYFEFYKYYFVNNWYSFNNNNLSTLNRNFNFNFNNNTLIINNELILNKIKNKTNIWSKTFNHFSTVIIILKFWHLIFIISFFLFSCVKYFTTKKISLDLIGSNYQNSLFIIIFYLITYVIFLKKNLYFLITYIYSFNNTTQNFSWTQINYYLEYFSMFYNFIY